MPTPLIAQQRGKQSHQTPNDNNVLKLPVRPTNPQIPCANRSDTYSRKHPSLRRRKFTVNHTNSSNSLHDHLRSVQARVGISLAK